MIARPLLPSRRGVALLGIFAIASCGEEAPPDEVSPPRDRPATTAELVGLVRTHLVRIGITETRAAKAVEGSKAWSDAGAGQIDCELERGGCDAEVSSEVDELIEDLFDPATIVRTTETETAYAQTIELGMSPYPVEWSLRSPGPDQVVLRLWLGSERTLAGQVRLSPTGAVGEASLSAFQTLVEMSSAMNELEDSDLLDRLTGTARWTIELTGPRSLRVSTELRSLGFEVGFLDGASLTFTSSGPLRVSATQDGERREASFELTLPPSRLSFPARLLQDSWRTRCEAPSDPCVPVATETVGFEAAGATLEASGRADSGAFRLEHVASPGAPWLRVTADGAEIARASPSSFVAEIQTAARELLVDLSSPLEAGFDFDVASLGHVIDAPADFRRERFTASARGRLSIRTHDQRGTVDLLRLLEGRVVGDAAVISQELRVEPGQCLLGLRDPRPGVPRDHPFAHLGVGSCQN